MTWSRGNTDNEPVIFKDDDSGYREWLADHQGSDTYVLNAERNPKPAYLILHRATCHTVSGEPGTRHSVDARLHQGLR